MHVIQVLGHKNLKSTRKYTQLIHFKDDEHVCKVEKQSKKQIISAVISAYAGYLRTKKGGTRSEDDPIIHLKQGPYAIMRHPSDFIFGLILPAFTIIASDQVPFTLYSIVGNILYFMLIHYTTVGEEELNILKWGDAYRQYQKEVPRFNFILGIWRWARKNRG